MNLEVKKLILSLMAVLPIPSVALAAQSKIYEIEGEAQSRELSARLAKSRSLVLPEMTMSSSIDDAFTRFQKLNLPANETSQEVAFQQHLDFLIANGKIVMDEGKIIASTPSASFP